MLIETVISIAVFAIVMIAVTSLITVSYNILTESSEQYAIVREAAAEIEDGTVGSAGSSATITYSVSGSGKVSDPQDANVYVDHPILFFETDS